MSTTGRNPALASPAGVSDFEETPLSLEDVYLALVGGKEAKP